MPRYRPCQRRSSSFSLVPVVSIRSCFCLSSRRPQIIPLTTLPHPSRYGSSLYSGSCRMSSHARSSFWIAIPALELVRAVRNTSNSSPACWVSFSNSARSTSSTLQRFGGKVSHRIFLACHNAAFLSEQHIESFKETVVSIDHGYPLRFRWSFCCVPNKRRSYCSRSLRYAMLRLHLIDDRKSIRCVCGKYEMQKEQ